MSQDQGAAVEASADTDTEETSFEELCKENYPKQWRVSTLLMWLLFLGFVGTSVFNNYRIANDAMSVLSNHTEVTAQVVEVIHILQDGEYEDYSVGLEYPLDGRTAEITIDIDEDVFSQNYANASEIPLIYSNDDSREINLRSYYEIRSDMFSNWISVLVGYVVVFVLLFFGRHYLLKVICSRTGE